MHFGPFTSDTEGLAECAEARFTDELGDFDRFIYARVPDKLVGIARSVKWKHSKAFNPDGKIVLQASRSVEGQVEVPQGFDPTKVTVRTRTLHLMTGPRDEGLEMYPREEAFPGLDTALPEIFDCRPDANGHIRFSDVPVRGRLYLITHGEGLGECSDGITTMRLSSRFN